jgi:SagB-type dehydrogenase family enzyme
MPDRPIPGNVRAVVDYHDRTKHRLDRYARSPGYMDWDNQPNPFRRFEGAPLLRLDHPPEDTAPTYDSLYGALPTARPLDRDAVSRLFYFSLALSAWKQVTGPDGEVRMRWSLRVDPSSGNLHPTEGYLIAGPIDGFHDRPAVYHYAPFEHGLELRRELDAIPGLSPGAVLIGLTSIHWREAWKYGERAFRYCQHDCGHAIAAVTLSAACLGWRARMLDGIDTARLTRLLGIDTQAGIEAEHADCLLLLSPGDEPAPDVAGPGDLTGGDWLGTPNQLSRDHHAWSILEEISNAARSDGFASHVPQELSPAPAATDRRHAAHRIIRQRRSAVSMDGRTSIDRETFWRILGRVMPRQAPHGVLPWRAAVSLLFFVHRVDGVDPGLYLLVRNPADEASLREALRSDFLWQHPDGCPPDLPFHLLVPSDVRDTARTLSCHQDIASDGAFAVSMLARFEQTLRAKGPAMYPRLFWETGVIGQVLYLEAEAAGVRGTGIGCFFDDAVHRILGVDDRSWQSLYHFTVGGPVDDPRLGTAGAYDHLEIRELHGPDAWKEA